MNQFQLPARRDLFYGGAWHRATGGTVANVSPSTGQGVSRGVAGRKPSPQTLTLFARSSRARALLDLEER